MKTKTLLLTLMFVAMSVVGAFGDKLQLSTTLPADGKPEHLYTMKNGNGWYVNASTSPTQSESNAALFAFYAVEGDANASYIYDYTAAKWLGYTKASSYSNGVSFVKLNDALDKSTQWAFSTTNSGDVQFQPYTSIGGGRI